MLTTAPPLPAAPPGRIARSACFRPSAVPTMFTSSMRRSSAGSISVTSAVTSMPALLIRMSKPPSVSTVAFTAASQSSSFVTSSVTKPAFAPPADSLPATSRPSDASTSPTITEAPAAASACAMPSPRPRAPPVTRAFRPLRSNLFMWVSCCDLDECPRNEIDPRSRLDNCQEGFGQVSRKRFAPLADARNALYNRRMATALQPRDHKFAERRAELGEAALQTLAELGYARTSLREIAQNSEFSHGVLHYYFTDKVDLILCSVRQYKARCVKRYDEVTTTATSFDELI